MKTVRITVPVLDRETEQEARDDAKDEVTENLRYIGGETKVKRAETISNPGDETDPVWTVDVVATVPDWVDWDDIPAAESFEEVAEK